MGEPTSNAAQAEFWGGAAGQNWVDKESVYDAMHAGIADLLVSRLAPSRGERVLDIGAGTGTVSLAVADRVRPGGHVTAVDVSPPMLGRAAERITEADRGDTVSVLLTDAQTHPFDGGSYDAVTSRFGVMFFEDPVAAFANFGGAVRAGGRLAMAVWQTAERNEFLSLPNSIVARHVGTTEMATTAAEPFSLGEPSVLRQVLDDAGWLDADLEADEGALLAGGPATVDQAIDFTLSRGHIASSLEGVSEDTRAAVREDFRTEFASRHDGEGVRLDYAIWIVTARRP